MHELLDFPDPNFFGVEFRDTLTEEDYDVLDSALADHLRKHTTTRVLFVMDDVDEWEPDEQWEELAFDIRHLSDLDKVAIVGDDLWETWIDKVEELFPTSLIQTYDAEDEEEALDWLRGDMAVPGLGPGSVPDPEATAQDADEE
ncbi:MAG: STAS/SEC14 domain-containing protein [Salinibacter sp.]